MTSSRKSSKKSYSKTYLKIDISDIRQFDIRGYEVIIYALIKSFNTSNKEFFMSRKEIAKKYCIGEATVSRVIERLEKKKLIRKQERPGTTNIYKICKYSDSKNESIKCYDVLFKKLNVNELIILSSIHSKYNTFKTIHEKLGIKKNTLTDNICSLKKKGYITSNRKEYTLTSKTISLLSNSEYKKEAETKEEVQKNNNVIFKSLIDIKELEDLKDKTEEDKKIIRFVELYNDICVYCAGIPKTIEKDTEDKILDIKDKYKDSEIIDTLKYFNNYVKNENKIYENNFVHLIDKFKLYYKNTKETSKKSVNRFNNFTQRNYTKEDFEELEKTFFN